MRAEKRESKKEKEKKKTSLETFVTSFSWMEMQVLFGSLSDFKIINFFFVLPARASGDCD